MTSSPVAGSGPPRVLRLADQPEAPATVPAADEVRFRELFESNYRQLIGYALRRVTSADDATDLVADTLLVAWRRLSEVPDDGTERLWLYGVARRVLANHRRGAIRRERLGDRLRHELHQIVPDPADASDSAVVVRAAMARLGDDDRELLMLTSWDGLEPREAAVVLGVPARIVRTRLHRARGRLRKLLGDAFSTGGHERDDNHPAPSAQEER
ncbi:RNA polymerase sigma factor [Kribbella turkmenica]|uniref:RNA polymerase sigma factor n=1 Tax=Kribbella turkmenica TaxID=2530375 RepID=A0A4R4W425_9ACTN|nr:RNA polymerase sigma factor [Kribbella turkmenica]TDD13339.1 RNA polymerase sigma factor [Kribbella turkmenica]